MRSKSPFKIVGPPWFRDMCAGYLASLTRKGRRPRTLDAYISELRAAGGWLQREAIADAEQLTGGHLERFQDFRASMVVPRTQQVAAAAMRGLLRWAATREPPLVPAALWLRVVSPRIPHLLPRPIPHRDLELLLVALASRPEPQSLGEPGICRTHRIRSRPKSCHVCWHQERQYLLQLRTRALFHVILSSAARITEALSLDRDQLQDRQAVVIQKGGHEKLIVISKTAEAAVADYLAARSDSCEALFVTHGLTQPTTRVTYKQNRRGPQFGWDQLRARLGIRRFTSHMIRHTTATMLLRQKVDSLVIAKHMGQRGLQAIQGYAEVGLDTRHEMLQVLDERIRMAS